MSERVRGTSMDERDTLIRVEQQLQDSIKNQSLILDDLKEIFGKIEEESKRIAAVKSELYTHLETSSVRREDTERRFKALEQQCEKINEDIETFDNDFTKSMTDADLFQKQVKSSVGLVKWVLGGIVVIITAIWPIIAFVLKP